MLCGVDELKGDAIGELLDVTDGCELVPGDVLPPDPPQADRLAAMISDKLKGAIFFIGGLFRGGNVISAVYVGDR
jgi:hypothetical protein